MKEQPDERRRFPRIKTELLVRYKVLETPDNELEGLTKDISEGGVCLVAREKFTSGTVLVLELKFPKSAEPIVAYGTVIWSRESTLGVSPGGHMRFDNGVEFKQIEEADRQRISEHVTEELQKKQTQGWKVGIVKDFTD